tara:strand:+ start:964 stop:1413 length:450 start_codon:yes stop_codon:yes gene_type:complete
MCISNHKELTQDNYRSELIISINATHDRLVNAVSLFNARKAINPINSEMLKKFPFFEWVSLNDKVRIYRRSDRFPEKYLSFDTEMLEGGEFGEHFHADLIESTEVVSGEMFDTYYQRYYKKGDVAHYDKGQKHTPIATKKTILHVLFKP